MSHPPVISHPTFELLTLTMIPGLGPVLIGRAVRHLGGPSKVLAATPGELQSVPGIGPEKARSFVEGRAAAVASAHEAVARAGAIGARVVGLGNSDYPQLLRSINDPPPVLFVRGQIEQPGAAGGAQRDAYPLALVGSRDCTQYGREQTARFASSLGSAGITIISGGARGIDTAAHQAALMAGGRTIVVLGCGIARAYPPENQGLFDQIVSHGRGAVLSELPIDTPPTAENFPARNRIISGLSLGVLLIEAARGSGSLITARLAAEDHGREVFALPGRVDSPASEGTNDLIKSGGAHLVTSPADVLGMLEQPARHAFGGTHADRYSSGLFEGGSVGTADAQETQPAAIATLSSPQRAIYDALTSPLDADELLKATGLDAKQLRAELTMLELRRLVARSAGRFARRG